MNRAETFIHRSISEAEGWLDQIQEAKASLAADDVEGLRGLVQAWKVPIEQGRKALGLAAIKRSQL